MTARLDRYAMLKELGIDELSLPTQSFESLCKLVDIAIAANSDFDCTYDVRSGDFLPAPELSESHPFVQVFMEGACDEGVSCQIVWEKGTIEFLDRNGISEIGKGILDIGDSLTGYEAWSAYIPLSGTTGRSGLVEALEFCCFLSNWFSSDPIRVILSFLGCNDLKWAGGIEDQILKTDSYLASHLWPAAAGLGVPPNRVFKQTQAVTDLSTAPRRAPADSYDFEILCGEWMSWFGVRDVKVSPPGKDGGVDVTGRGVIAQSKFHPSQKVAEPDVRDLIGCRLIFGVNHAWFFHYGPGYPESVVKLCQEGLAELFQFDSTTLSFVGVTGYAAALCRGVTKHTD
jgi:hypothetical protein